MRTIGISLAAALIVGAAACGSGDDATGSASGASASSGAGGGSASSSGAGAGSTSSSTGAGGSVAPPGCDPLPKASGATIAVDPSQDLAAVAQGAAAGTTLVLAPGTYAVGATIQLSKDGLGLRSSTDVADDVILDGGYVTNEVIAISASNVTVAHVTVERAINHPIHIYPPGPGVNVEKPLLYGLHLVDGGEQFVKVNPIQGQEGWIDDGVLACSSFEMTAEGRTHVESCCGGCYTGGIDAHSAWHWTVRDNRFEGIHCENGGLAEHAIHFWKGSRDTIVERNVIVDCARGIGFGLQDGTGERAYPDAPYGGAMLAHYDGVIRNNIVWADTPWFDTGIELDSAREPLVIHNTVVKGAGATNAFSSIDYRFADTVVTIRNNLTDRITVRDGATGTVDTNLEMTPLALFVAPATADLHLVPSASAAIDQAATLPEAGTDIDGQAHDHGPPDLGADEYVP